MVIHFPTLSPHVLELPFIMFLGNSNEYQYMKSTWLTNEFEPRMVELRDRCFIPPLSLKLFYYEQQAAETKGDSKTT